METGPRLRCLRAGPQAFLVLLVIKDVPDLFAREADDFVGRRMEEKLLIERHLLPNTRVGDLDNVQHWIHVFR